MSCETEVLLGPAGAGKTHELLGRYAAVLSQQPAEFGKCLWLAPSSRSATLVRGELADRLPAACLSPGVMTFGTLVQQIATSANLKSQVIGPVARRELLRRVVASEVTAKRVTFFAAAANRAGFIDLLVEHLRELGERDIRPAAYKRFATSRGASARHRELAEIFAAYDQQLVAHELCDTETLISLVCHALSEGRCCRFRELAYVVVDGFTDFTPVQLKLLCELAKHAQRLHLTLPADTPDSPRADVFARPTATLAELERVFPGLKARHLAARPGVNAALAHVVNNIFRHPVPPVPPAAQQTQVTLEIVETAGEQDEIEQLARRVKSRLATARPDEVVVVFRSLPAVAARVEEVFSRCGIPYSLETGRPLFHHAVLRALMSLLELELDDWPFRRVVSVITNNQLGGISASERQAIEWLVRELQIAHGRSTLLEEVQSLALQAPQQAEFSEAHRRRVGAAVASLPVLEALAAALDRLPRQATLEHWLDALDGLAIHLGVASTSAAIASPAHAGASPGKQPEGNAGHVVSSLLGKHFAALVFLDSQLGTPPRQYDRREVFELLLDIATQEKLPRSHADAGHVQILSAPAARAVRAKHLFLAGMSEQSFPSPASSASLATESEYRYLTAKAQDHSAAKRPSREPESPAVSRSQGEMLLFLEVLSRAQESLTITYAALDDKAQPLPPSPYVVELVRLFQNCERPLKVASPHLSPVPPRDFLAAPRDWRTVAVAQAIQPESDGRLLAGLLSAEPQRTVAAAICAGLRTVHARSRGESFGPFEGMLEGTTVREHLAHRFGPKHVWSTSRLETFAACPFKFFMQSVLGFEPLDDLALETDVAARGSLLHEVLATFHRKFSGSAAEWSAVLDDVQRFADELKAAIEAASLSGPTEGLDAALAELDQRQIERWMKQYPAQINKYNDTWKQLDEQRRPRPAYFELRFGHKHTGETGPEDERSTDNSFLLDLGDEKIHLAGRIDRIDVVQSEGRTLFNVIDYKSGKRPSSAPEKIESGECLQPALYVLAAQAIVFADDNQAQPLWAGYWSIKTGITTDKRFSLHCSTLDGDPTEAWTKLEPLVKARVGEMVRAVRHGDFPVESTQKDCTSTCDFRTVCRIAQARSMEKAVVDDGSEIT
ncbi:MAG: exodeoxyribonuclease V subunit gamma [Pirellulales bacterium]|nr:exodeoxyribonuclease V subunit gamma [Pirellulales bacterium]